MLCATHARFFVRLVAMLLCGNASTGQRNTAGTGIAQKPLVTIRWGARPGVSRYRLQLANHQDFADIVFDRVVYGHEYQVPDLFPVEYFWRVASLNGKLGEFSSAGVIEVTPNPTGVLFIATDPGRGGLRALEFPQAVAPRN
jgi:hypothetical protein